MLLPTFHSGNLIATALARSPRKQRRHWSRPVQPLVRARLPEAVPGIPLQRLRIAVAGHRRHRPSACFLLFRWATDEGTVSSCDRLLSQPFFDSFSVAVMTNLVLIGNPQPAITNMQPSLRSVAHCAVYDEASIPETCRHFFVGRWQTFAPR